MAMCNSSPCGASEPISSSSNSSGLLLLPWQVSGAGCASPVIFGLAGPPANQRATLMAGH